MFSYFRRKIYVDNVLGQVMAMTLMLDGDLPKLFLKNEDYKNAARHNFESGTPESHAAIYITCSLMLEMLPQIDGVRRDALIAELDKWSQLDPAEQRAMKQSYLNGESDDDFLLTRCKWCLLMGQDMLLEDKIDNHQYLMLKDSIYGPLRADKPVDRIKDRMMPFIARNQNS